MIVECQMCFDLHNVTTWEETDIFICQICTDILSKIRKEEIELEKKGIKTSNAFRLALFDMRREDYKNDQIRK